MDDLASPFPTLTGARLGGRYLVEASVGRGAVSEVYRATDLRDGGSVAVKVLRTGAPDARRFQKEVDLLRRLRHEHLVALCDAGEHRGLPYLVLELLDHTVADAIAAGPVPGDDVARIGREAAAALAYVHRHGIVHRDVKPSNVLLSGDGSVRLADLGAARLVDGGGITATGTTIGTPAYLAPEQVDGGAVGPAADVYALGLVLIEAASGRPAFTGTTGELLAARVVRRPEVPVVVPGAWRALVAAMTDLDPTRRPSAAEVAARLDERVLATAGADTEVLPASGARAATGAPSGDRTAVLPAVPIQGGSAGGTAVLPARPVDGAPGDGTAVLAPLASRAGGRRDGAARWLAARRERAGLWAVLGVVLLGLVLGLASAGGGSPYDVGPVAATTAEVPGTTTSVATTTTAPPPEAVVVPVDPCRGDDCDDDGDEGGRGEGDDADGRGPREEKGKPAKDDD